MRHISSFVLGVVVGGALVFTTQRYHVVRTDKGFEMVPKLQSGFSEAYVDVRHFSASDWEQHKTLAAAIMHSKKDHVFTDSASDQTRQGIGSFVDQFRRLQSG